MAKIRNLSLVLSRMTTERQHIRIGFIGDVSFNDDYVPLLEAGTDPFVEVRPALMRHDFVIGNLECMAKGVGENLDKRPRIGTTLRALQALKGLNLGLVTLATNHFYDNLEKGFNRTIQQLAQDGIASIGASSNQQNQYVPYVLEKKGWRIGFLNYVHPDTHPKIPPSAKVYPNYYKPDRVCSDIQKLKPSVDRVVVLLHWGGKTDYGYFPHAEQVAEAKQMISAGADAIVGCHTHSFQTHDSFNGKPVYYSLGNFCFADIKCDDGGFFAVRENGKKSAILSLTFSEKEVESEIYPFYNQNLILKPKKSLASEFSRWQLAYKFIKLMPFGFKFYYWALRRVEPIFYYSQIHQISLASIAFKKFKRSICLE